MAKNWKGIDPEINAIDRDAPCLIINNNFIIGTKEDTHSTLLHKMEFGMDVINSKKDYYEDTKKSGIEWNRIQTFYKKGFEILDEVGNYNTKEEMFEEEVCFGNIKDKVIYWESGVTDKKIILKKLKDIKNIGIKINDYKHFLFDYKNGSYMKIKL